MATCPSPTPALLPHPCIHLPSGWNLFLYLFWFQLLSLSTVGVLAVLGSLRHRLLAVCPFPLVLQGMRVIVCPLPGRCVSSHHWSCRHWAMCVWGGSISDLLMPLP